MARFIVGKYALIAQVPGLEFVGFARPPHPEARGRTGSAVDPVREAGKAGEGIGAYQPSLRLARFAAVASSANA